MRVDPHQFVKSTNSSTSMSCSYNKLTHVLQRIVSLGQNSTICSCSIARVHQGFCLKAGPKIPSGSDDTVSLSPLKLATSTLPTDKPAHFLQPCFLNQEKTADVFELGSHRIPHPNVHKDTQCFQTMRSTRLRGISHRFATSTNSFISSTMSSSIMTPTKQKQVFNLTLEGRDYHQSPPKRQRFTRHVQTSYHFATLLKSSVWSKSFSCSTSSSSTPSRGVDVSQPVHNCTINQTPSLNVGFKTSDLRTDDTLESDFSPVRNVDKLVCLVNDLLLQQLLDHILQCDNPHNLLIPRRPQGELPV